MTYRADSAVTAITLHYSATPIEKNFTAAAIDKMHKKRGFKGIGYHYYIRKDGTVETGRDMSKAGKWEQGAHCKGSNHNSIGICCEGGVKAADPNVGLDTRTPEQTKALIKLIRELLVRFPDAKIIGHRDMPKAATQCPGYNATEWWASASKPAPSIAAQPRPKGLLALILQLLGVKS